MPSSSYFTQPLDFNHQTPSISNVSIEFYSKTSSRFPQVHRKFKKSKSFPILPPHTLHCAKLTSWDLRSPSSKEAHWSSLFSLPLSKWSLSIQSLFIPPIHSHSHCLIQSLNQLYQFLRLIFSPASNPTAVSFTVQSKIQTT